MSRIGKKLIAIPSGVDVKISGQTVSVKGSQGSLSRDFKGGVVCEMVEGGVKVAPAKMDVASRALWGTTVAHISNMVKGVTTLFQKKLIIEGIGFKAEVKGEDLVMNLGFSHQVKVKVPKNLKVTAEKNVIVVSGVDVETVGQFSAQIRDYKKPEPYKGKGIRYDGEVIRRKQGKKTA